ncbi:mitochondrial ribosomal protein L17 [Lentinula raphanica]|uniref:Mitochondrial ribosomal protein L17 n=1 Tax=Lentinula raphanica TaxID=153919 RepID=A0AA38PLI7_9AGAR|nr:mitochondrial ribosomal protein L17 [Lentinula raphanica]
MKHGVAFRKFSRPTSHRMLMLRNLVTSLFEHEQIKTTLPKARDTARLAEKAGYIITLGKKGDRSAQARASAFLLKPEILPKLFGTFANRYAERPGGYTRIHKYGNRPGDNAPVAILELVDSPRDLRWEITARAIGREVLNNKLETEKPLNLIKTGVHSTQDIIESEKRLAFGQNGLLRPKTRWNMQKILRFRNQDAVSQLSRNVGNYIVCTLSRQRRKTKTGEFSLRAGQTAPGDTRSVLDLSQGSLGTQRPRTGPKNVTRKRRWCLR